MPNLDSEKKDAGPSRGIHRPLRSSLSSQQGVLVYDEQLDGTASIT